MESPTLTANQPDHRFVAACEHTAHRFIACEPIGC